MDDPLRGIEGRALLSLGASRALGFVRLRCAVQIENNVLARAMHPHDSLALQRRSDECTRRFERLFFGTDPDRFDGVTGDAFIEALRDGFDFRAFGHAVRIDGLLTYR